MSACVVVGEQRGTDEEIARVNVDLAVAYYQEGRLDFALKNVNKALKADSRSVGANSIAALIYSRLDEKQLAQDHFEVAADYVSSDSIEYGQIHNNFGVFLCVNGQYSVAQDHFLLAIENKLYQKPEVAYESAGLCALNKPDLGDALFYFQKALALNADMPRVLLEIAEIEIKSKRYLKAQAYLLRFHRLHEVVSRSLWIAAQIETAMGNEDGAQELLSQLRQQFPESVEVINLGIKSLVVEQ